MAIGTFSLVALDCPDPAELCRFYQAIVGGTIKAESQSEDWVRLRTDTGCDLGFQRDPNHLPPDWPVGSIPQQIHLDVDVDDLDEGERQVLAIGARKAETQPEPDQWRVFIDPAGHPFCLVKV